MRPLVSLLCLALLGAVPARYSCTDYLPKLDRVSLTIAPGHTDSLTISYWVHANGDSVPTTKLPSRCHVRWSQVPPRSDDVTLTPAVGLPLSRTRVYVGVLGTALDGIRVGVTASAYYQ